jgi:hypothetical protein
VAMDGDDADADDILDADDDDNNPTAAGFDWPNPVTLVEEDDCTNNDDDDEVDFDRTLDTVGL